MLVFGIVPLLLTSSKRFSCFHVTERGFSCWNICYAHHICIYVYFGWGAGHPKTTERKVITTAVLSLTLWNQSAGKKSHACLCPRPGSSLIQTDQSQAPQWDVGFVLLNTFKPSFEESPRNSKGALNYTREASVLFCVKNHECGSAECACSTSTCVYSISVPLWLVSLCGQGSGETRADLGRTVVTVAEGFSSLHWAPSAAGITESIRDREMPCRLLTAELSLKCVFFILLATSMPCFSHEP